MASKRWPPSTPRKPSSSSPSIVPLVPKNYLVVNYVSRRQPPQTANFPATMADLALSSPFQLSILPPGSCIQSSPTPPCVSSCGGRFAGSGQTFAGRSTVRFQVQFHGPAVGVVSPLTVSSAGQPRDGVDSLRTVLRIGTPFEIRAAVRAAGQITPTAAGQPIKQVLLKGEYPSCTRQGTITRLVPLAPSAGPSPFPHLSTRSGTDSGWLGNCPSLGLFNLF